MRKGQFAAARPGTRLDKYIPTENIMGIMPLPKTFNHERFPLPSWARFSLEEYDDERYDPTCIPNREPNNKCADET
jgi:hypothetical protein